MNRTLSSTMASVVAGIFILAVPAQSAVLDQVQDKVNDIKQDTATIKNRTADIVSQTREQLQETVDIRGALAPLFDLQDRFGQIGIDPGGFLEMIPMDEIQIVMDELRRRREETQDAMNDPHVEGFRADFVEMLRGISNLVSDDGTLPISPLQTLVENAPVKLIALLKIATQDIFPEMKETIVLQVDNMRRLRELGLVWDNPLLNAVADRSAIPNGLPATTESKHPSSDVLLVANQVELAAQVDGWAIFCSAWGQALEVPVLAITTYQIRNAKFLSRLNTLEDRMDDKEMAIPFQIHGYIGLTLEPGKNVHHAISDTITRLERQQEVLNLTKEYITFLSLSGACDVATEVF